MYFSCWHICHSLASFKPAHLPGVLVSQVTLPLCAPLIILHHLSCFSLSPCGSLCNVTVSTSLHQGTEPHTPPMFPFSYLDLPYLPTSTMRVAVFPPYCKLEPETWHSSCHITVTQAFDEGMKKWLDSSLQLKQLMILSGLGMRYDIFYAEDLLFWLKKEPPVSRWVLNIILGSLC